MEDDILEIELKSDYDLNLKTFALIRNTLNLSRAQFEVLFDSNIIRLAPNEKTKNSKFKNGQKIIIDTKGIEQFIRVRESDTNDSTLS